MLAGDFPPLPDPSEAIDPEDLSIADMWGMEPALEVLEREADAIRAGEDKSKPFCANAVWYGYGEPLHARSRDDRLLEVVGPRARNPKLRSRGALEIAFDWLYGMLPDCRGCLC